MAALYSKTEADHLQERKGTVKIRQTGSGQASSIFYDCLYLGEGSYDHVAGIEFCELPTNTDVRMGLIAGYLRFIDRGQANILGAVHLGRTVVEGAHLPKTGFLGYLFHNDVLRDYALTVKDNQDIVIGDLYQEQTDRALLIEGGGRTGTGRVTLGLSRFESYRPPFVTVRDYEGRIWLSGGIIGAYSGPAYGEKIVADRIPDNLLDAMAKALGDFRELGQINVKFNYAQ